MAEESTRRKPGPIPYSGPPRRKFIVMLDEHLGEWGKRQPEGLSELLRRLLREERRRIEGKKRDEGTSRGLK